MKYLVTFYELNALFLLKNADGFVMGNDQFGTRLTRSFSLEDIKHAANFCQQHEKELFILANQMMDDDLIIQFKAFVESLPLDLIKGIIVADIGAAYVLESLGYAEKVVYHPETLLTNVFDFNYLSKRQYLGAFVAKEITLDDVLEIARNKQYHVFMTGHGYLDMFYSRRHLIHNYETFLEHDHHLQNRQDIRLVEEMRKDLSFPILEDRAGTHVFRSHILSSLKVLDQLEPVIDYFLIDTIFQDDIEGHNILSYYVNQRKDVWDSSWDEGFFTTKTIYKK